MLESCRFLFLRELGLSTRIARRQVELLLVLVVSALEKILGWITELADGGPHAFAQLDVELNGSNPIFVGYMNYLLVVQVFVGTPSGSEVGGVQHGTCWRYCASHRSHAQMIRATGLPAFFCPRVAGLLS